MKIIVTGAAGFIGANLVKGLNARNEYDIVAVDDLTEGDKFKNLVDLRIADYIDKEVFLDLIKSKEFSRPEVVFHQGACSDTMETDGRYMMENNYRYSLALLEWCQEQKIPFIYASSAAVYGMGSSFVEGIGNERPLNVYGYSKFLFDQLVRQRLASLRAPVIGLRYFNVYGPREAHKGRMASVAWHHFAQYRSEKRVKLFEGSHGYANGEQRRDFIYVDDVIRVNMHFWDKPVSGVYNVGTGRAQSFNDIASTVVNTLRIADGLPLLPLADLVNEGSIEYIAFPNALKGKYQAFTRADLTQLREAGCSTDFQSVEQGTSSYVQWLSSVDTNR